jgi:hypothetical protein
MSVFYKLDSLAIFSFFFAQYDLHHHLVLIWNMNMKFKLINTALHAMILSFSCLAVNANATIIFAEDFSGGSAALKNSSLVTWVDSDGGGFEVYDSASSGPRGMSGTFDHDNNLNTPNISLPGALEVNDDSGNVLLTATFTLESIIAANQTSILSFFGGVRGGNASGASVEIFNLTENTSLSGLLSPTLGAKNWVYNEFRFASPAASIGDQLQLRWNGGGTNSANGQEIALVSFSVVDVPEPSALGLLALGMFGLATRRYKKKS